MTELPLADDARLPDGDPRVRWVVLSVLVLATVSIAWHPLFAVAVPGCSYLLGRLRTPGWLATVVLGLTVALSPALLGTDWWDPRVWSGVAVAAVLLGYLPWLFGRHVRDRVDLDRVEAELVAHLEQRQWELAARTRLRERARIAQEMHDTLGHQLSLIALRAGALEVGVDSESPATSKAAEELRSATTRAAEQLGAIVGVLADPSEPAGPQSYAKDLDTLLRHAAAAGMDVEFDGSQSDLASVPVVVARAALRVVQEGLTNAAKHAPGATVRVQVDQRQEDLIVSVVDTGATPGHAEATVGGGRGLAGLADRVDYLGGRLRAAPGDSGFELIAHLPLRPDPVGVADEGGYTDWRQAELTAGRRDTRRSLAWAILAPVALLLLIAVCFTSYFVYVTVASVLTADEFARIEVGDAREQTEAILPPVEMLEPPVDRLPPPTTPGATCAYYEGEVSFFERREVYRVCFASGQVTDVDVLAPETP